MIHALGYPTLFHGIFIAVFLVLAVFSTIRQWIPLMVFSIFFLVLAGVSWTWSRRAMQHVSCRIELSRNRAFPDESIALFFELTNEKWLPLPWVQIEQAVPCRLATGTLRPASRYSKERLRWTTAVCGRQRLKWEHQLICRARGDYRLGPLRLRSGDLFGLFPGEMVIQGSESLLVYPRIIPDSRLLIILTEFMGELEAARRFYEDLSRSTGPRDYRYHDPFKRIHWKATAKQGRLQVRQFESSTGLSLLLLLDVQSFCSRRQEDEETFELAVSIAATVAHELHGARWPVGLMTNSVSETQIPVSSDRNQLRFILEALARVRRAPACSLQALFERESSRFYPGTVLVLITQGPSSSLAPMIRDIKRRGYSLFLVTFEPWQAGEDLNDIPVFCVARPGSIPANKETVS